MRNHKGLFAIMIASILVIIGTAAFIIIRFTNKEKNGDGVTAGEWMEMLCDHTGADMFDLPKGYEESDKADARLIAVTAFSTIDSHKLCRIIDDYDTYGDEEYYNLAKQYQLLPEIKKAYTVEDCRAILARYNELYFGEFWLDDYCEVQYKDSVKELDITAMVQSNGECDEVNFGSTCQVAQGDIVIFSDENGYKRTGKVESVGADGTCQLSQPDLTEVLSSFDFSDIEELDYSEIVEGNDFYGNVIQKEHGQTLYGGIYAPHMQSIHASEDVISHHTTAAGMEFTLSVEDNENSKFLAITISDNETGDSVKYISPVVLGDDAEGELKINISDITIASDMTYFKFDKSEKYAEYRLDMNTEVSGSLSVGTDEEDFKIPIFKKTVPFEYGLVCLDFEVYAQMTAEGTFEIKASFPTSACIRYDKEGGLRLLKDSSVQMDSSAESSLSAEIEFAVCADADLRIFIFFDLVGVGIKGGALGTAEVIERDTGMVCTDLSVSFPVVKGNAHFGFIFIDVETEFDIVSADDTKIWSYHHEYVPGIRDGRVPECSYGNDELMAKYNSNAELSMLYGHNLYSKFETNMISSTHEEMGENEAAYEKYQYDITDTGNGYELVGKISFQNRMPDDVFWSLEHQSSVKNLGVTYDVVSFTLNDMGRPYCELLGDNGKTVVISNDITPYWDGFSEGYRIMGDEEFVIENAKIFIPYGTEVEEIVHQLCENGGNNGNPGMEVFGIKFDENGNVSAITPYRY